VARPPWMPNSRVPHDRDEKETTLQNSSVGTLANSSSGRGGTPRNQLSTRRHRTRHRSRSMHRAVNDDSIDALKVIESGLRTPGLVHHLLVVSTVCVVLCFVFICLHFFSSSVNIQQWASPFTTGVSRLSRPDQLTRLQSADNEYLRWTSADRVFQLRSVRGKNEYL